MTSFPPPGSASRFPRDRRGLLGAPRRPRRAPGPARRPRLRRRGPEDPRHPGRRARHPAAVPGQRGARRARRSSPSSGHLHTEVCTTFDWPKVPELYVSQTPFFNAGAYGVDNPFIVLHSAAIELLDDDELRVLHRPRDGPRDQRPRALSHHRRDPRPASAWAPCPILAGHRAPAGPARVSRVVAQVGALRRPRRPARQPGRHRHPAAVHEDGRRRPRRRASRAR